MVKTLNERTIQPRLVGIQDFMRWTGLGRNRARELGQEMGCCRKIGGRVLYDLRIASEYLDRWESNDKQ